MSEEFLKTQQIRSYVADWQAGQNAGRDKLIEAILYRIETKTRRMLGRFPNVRSVASTDDVKQEVVLRLLKGLENLDPATTRTVDLFNFIAAAIRWELLDLARYVGSRPDLKKRMKESDLLGSEGHKHGLRLDQIAESSESITDIDRWTDFHASVAELLDDERTVYALNFYLDLTQLEIAELLGVCERTVRTRLVKAKRHLIRLLNGKLPLAA